MKIIRSSRCSLGETSSKKRKQVQEVLIEYGRVVNIFISEFWEETPSKSKLLKPIMDLPQTNLSARLRKVAAREAIDMVLAAKKRDDEKAVKPVHRGNRMHVSSTIATLLPSKKSTEFDAWLHLASIGEKIILDLPIRFHKHFYKLSARGKRLESYIITKDYVQFSFEIETGEKLKSGNLIGVDTGVKSLASLSNGEQFGRQIESQIEAIKRCRQGSKEQVRRRRSLKQTMCEVANEISKGARLLVVEKLKNVTRNTKIKRRLSKNVRRTLGSWAYRYWLERLELACEWNRVSFRTVSPYQTSIRCSSCGHIERRNRDREIFLCRDCGYNDNADLNAAKNILSRFLSGPYGAGFKPCSI